jgi:S1-C subfamily serine protease
MEAQFCGRCGRPRRDAGDRFCSSCGAPLEERGRAPRRYLLSAALALVFFALGAAATRFFAVNRHLAPASPARPAASPALAARPLPELIRQVRPAVVTIQVYKPNGRDGGFGSGFFIAADGRIITNHHVLAGARRAVIRTADGSPHAAAFVIADDRKADLTELLAFFDHDTPYLRIAEKLPQVGARVIVLGSPLGFDETVSEGIVSALPAERRADAKDLGPATLQITAPISEGSSGGPVIDLDGRVVGIANTTFLDAQELNFAVPAGAIRSLPRFVPRTLANWRKRRWWPTAFEWYQAGFADWYIGDCASASDFFTRAIARNPRLAEAWWGRGVCARELGRNEAALEDLEKAVALKPGYARAHYDLAQVAAALGDTEQAEREREMVARLDPALAGQLGRKPSVQTRRAASRH